MVLGHLPDVGGPPKREKLVIFAGKPDNTSSKTYSRCTSRITWLSRTSPDGACASVPGRGRLRRECGQASDGGAGCPEALKLPGHVNVSRRKDVGAFLALSGIHVLSMLVQGGLLPCLPAAIKPGEAPAGSVAVGRRASTCLHVGAIFPPYRCFLALEWSKRGRCKLKV